MSNYIKAFKKIALVSILSFSCIVVSTQASNSETTLNNEIPIDTKEKNEYFIKKYKELLENFEQEKTMYKEYSLIYLKNNPDDIVEEYTKEEEKQMYLSKIKPYTDFVDLIIGKINYLIANHNKMNSNTYKSLKQSITNLEKRKAEVINLFN